MQRVANNRNNAGRGLSSKKTEIIGAAKSRLWFYTLPYTFFHFYAWFFFGEVPDRRNPTDVKYRE